jgi:hypothetical protein
MRSRARGDVPPLLTNANISVRIKEIQTRVSEAVIAKGTYTRQRSLAILEDSVNRRLAMREFRAATYGHQLGEGRTWVVHDEAEESLSRRATRGPCTIQVFPTAVPTGRR